MHFSSHHNLLLSAGMEVLRVCMEQKKKYRNTAAGDRIELLPGIGNEGEAAEMTVNILKRILSKSYSFMQNLT